MTTPVFRTLAAVNRYIKRRNIPPELAERVREEWKRLNRSR